MHVSVVITNHDYERFLADAIDSALGQTHPDVEVVVVDDGSSDGSREVIAGYGERVVPVLRPHAGQGAAVNAGFAASTGEAVIFLDADDILMPGAAAAAAELLAEPGVVKAHWPMLLADEHGRPTGGCEPSQPLDGGDLRDRLWTCPRYTTPPMSGNAYARWCLEQVLPMPEAPFPAGADCFLYQLVIPFGEVRTAAEPLSIYRRHAGSTSAQAPLERIRRWAALDDAAWTVLARVCARRGLPAPVEHWRRTSFNHRLAGAVDDIAAVVPAGEPFLLADDNGTLGLHGTGSLRPVPWWGTPGDAGEAWAELERRRAAGVRWLVVAWPAFWWLAYLRELQEHLHAGCRLVAASERVRVYDLQRPAGPRLRAEREPVQVVMCAFRRPDRLPRTLAMLAEQDGCVVELHVWNNEPANAAAIDAALAASPLPAHVHHSHENVGGFGRFHLAAALRARHERVVFVDDDVDFAPTAIATLVAEHRPRSIGSFYAHRFRSPDDYFDRRECRPGEAADYCGTGGMVCDTAIFAEPELFACPARFRPIEDLWLSYFAAHRHGWRLYRSDAAFHLHVDEHDQWRALRERKSAFLRHLVAAGWEVGRERPVAAVQAGVQM